MLKDLDISASTFKDIKNVYETMTSKVLCLLYYNYDYL